MTIDATLPDTGLPDTGPDATRSSPRTAAASSPPA